MSDTLIARMQVPGPKKILALDGGGIRGMIAVEVLADYSDFVLGTSGGNGKSGHCTT